MQGRSQGECNMCARAGSTRWCCASPAREPPVARFRWRLLPGSGTGAQTTRATRVATTSAPSPRNWAMWRPTRCRPAPRRWRAWAKPGSRLLASGRGQVVLVGDVLVPDRRLAGGGVPLLDREMGHQVVGRRAMPVPLPRPDHDRVTRPHLTDRAVLALDPADALDDVQHLAERVHVPGGPGPRHEMHPERAHQAR